MEEKYDDFFGTHVIHTFPNGFSLVERRRKTKRGVPMLPKFSPKNIAKESSLGTLFLIRDEEEKFILGDYLESYDGKKLYGPGNSLANNVTIWSDRFFGFRGLFGFYFIFDSDGTNYNTFISTSIINSCELVMFFNNSPSGYDETPKVAYPFSILFRVLCDILENALPEVKHGLLEILNRLVAMQLNLDVIDLLNEALNVYEEYVFDIKNGVFDRVEQFIEGKCKGDSTDTSELDSTLVEITDSYAEEVEEDENINIIRKELAKIREFLTLIKKHPDYEIGKESFKKEFYKFINAGFQSTGGTASPVSLGLAV